MVRVLVGIDFIIFKGLEIEFLCSNVVVYGSLFLDYCKIFILTDFFFLCGLTSGI